MNDRPNAEINHPDPWDTRVLDSTIAACAAAEALAAGRVELGYEFSRVALRAHLAELRRPLPPVSAPIYDSAAAQSPFFASPATSQPIHPYEEQRAVDTAVFTPMCPHCGTHLANEACPMNRAITAHCQVPKGADVCRAIIWFNPLDGLWRHVHNHADHEPQAPLEVHEAALDAARVQAAQQATEQA